MIKNGFWILVPIQIGIGLAFTGTDLVGGWFFTGSLDCWCKVEARELPIQLFAPQNQSNTIRIYRILRSSA